MAVVNDYSAGTVSVAAGGTAVTGVGTAWQTAGVQAGDLFMRAGFAVPIAAVNSNTSITLAENWPGAALNNSAYRIRFQPDGSRYSAAARALIELLANGKLESFAALAGAADRLPYFTGANTLGLATLSAFARTLLDDANAAAVYATLGQVPDAQAVPGYKRVLQNASNQNANDYSESGFYFLSTGSTNLPDGNLHGYLLVITYGPTNSVQQFFFESAGQRVWKRYHWFNSQTWSAWSLIAGQYVGAVSQSGGAPTGAIIERGSNANGEYVRFADGTQICTITGFAGAAATTAVGNLFRTAGATTWTFPAAFAGLSVVAAMAEQNSSWANCTITGTTSANLFRFCSTSDATARNYWAVAIGRWF